MNWVPYRQRPVESVANDDAAYYGPFFQEGLASACGRRAGADAEAVAGESRQSSPRALATMWPLCLVSLHPATEYPSPTQVAASPEMNTCSVRSVSHHHFRPVRRERVREVGRPWRWPALAVGICTAAACGTEPPVATTVEVTPDSAALVEIGQTVQLVARVLDQDEARMLDAAVTWSSADATVATVDPAGLVTAVGEGETTVTATAGTVTGDVHVTARDERAALIAFFEATNGDRWIVGDGWGTDRALREWFGVSVNGSEHVVGLRLPGNQLSGSLPPELGKLGALDFLYLHGNQLSGPIPPELGDLAALRILSLHGNELSGSLPAALGDLGSVTDLLLGHNRLTGPIPSELGGLGSLNSLRLEYNELTGSIPSELGRLDSLTSLWLAGNELTGAIPPELADLELLTSLDLSGNRLNEPIPAELGGLDMLRTLRLGDNELRGSIPAALGNIDSLGILGLARNELTGTLPPELANPASLTELGARNNRLEGCIPQALQRFRALINPQGDPEEVDAQYDLPDCDG